MFILAVYSNKLPTHEGLGSTKRMQIFVNRKHLMQTHLLISGTNTLIPENTDMREEGDKHNNPQHKRISLVSGEKGTQRSQF